MIVISKNEILKNMKTNITELKEGLIPFTEDIFVKDQLWLRNYLLPLISIDLGLVREDLKGTVVHMLNPKEPYGGAYIGEQTKEFHNEFCGENWIAFQLNQDNTYQFLGDENYFLSAPKHKNKVDDYFVQHIKEVQQNYEKVKAKYKTTGQLLPRQDDSPRAFLSSLGGEMYNGNWAKPRMLPSAFKMTQADWTEELPNDGITITYKNKEFIFVGEASASSYCDDGPDGILLFFEPESRIILFTYDWT